MTRRDQAFTRLELLAVLATIGANNLRQVGRAFHMWASDHGGENPWWTHYNNGGSYIPVNSPPPNVYNVPGAGAVPVAVRNQAWLQFGFISEELRLPAVLVCPSDRFKVRAQAFSRTNGGFFHVGVLDRGVSYFIGLHALNQFPSTMLSGDRGINDHGSDNACPVNVGTMYRIEFLGRQGWSTNLHPVSGNVLFNDGRVEELTSSTLSRYFISPTDYNGSTHLIKPQP
jgi:hypothetical protein